MHYESQINYHFHYTALREEKRKIFFNNLFNKGCYQWKIVRKRNKSRTYERTKNEANII